jgi:hypothetical protein
MEPRAIETHPDADTGPDSAAAPLSVLYLCTKEIYETKMSRGRFHAVNALAEKSSLKISGNGWEDYRPDESVRENVFRLYGGEHPDVILAYKPLEHREFKNAPGLKVITYNEMWNVEETTREIVESGAGLVVAHHRNDIDRYRHLNCVDFENIPHCAEKSIYKDYGQAKDLDLLLIGAMDEYHYPFRSRLKALVENHLSQRLRCRVLQHPGYDLRGLRGLVLSDYARLINRSKITLTCSSRWKYRLAKYVEVPMCASMLAADLPDEDRAFFRKFMLVLDPEDPDGEIMDRLVRFALDDRLREQKVRAGLRLCKEFTQEHYADRLIRAIRRRLDRAVLVPPVTLQEQVHGKGRPQAVVPRHGAQ